jgi:hypothetical protein
MPTTTREVLPQRRYCETFEFKVPGQKVPFAVTIGRYYDGQNGDGRIGEVFVNSNKAGTETDVVARDAAILLSIALQHGLPVEAFCSAMTRNADGSPSSIIGLIVDRLSKADEPMATGVDNRRDRVRKIVGEVIEAIRS